MIQAIIQDPKKKDESENSGRAKGTRKGQLRQARYIYKS